MCPSAAESPHGQHNHIHQVNDREVPNEAPDICSPGGTRTCNLPINSRTLCQLSYGGWRPMVRAWPCQGISWSHPRRSQLG